MESKKKLDSGVIKIPKPMEETDPELANFFENLVKYNVANKEAGRPLSHVEIERFIADGVERNDPCPCGALRDDDSGKPKKFKKCCMLNRTPFE